ncbi:MAG: glycosyltransferase family 1 protein [Bacteroidota bacterium]|nr:glycosyltransferase family 1 protein [Bacteroidota bacterium]
MRIGFDAKRAFSNNTGLGNYSRDAIKVLSHYFPDDKYFLYTPKKNNNHKLAFINDRENIAIQTPESLLNRTLKAYWRSKSVVKDLLANKIDIYHGLSNELPIGIETTSIKTVVTIHDLIFMRYPNLFKAIDRKIYHKKFKSACQRANKIIAISKQTKEDIIDFFCIPEEKIEVVYQGCNKVFQSKIHEDEKQSTISKYDLPKNYLLYVGTIEERKNLLTLLQALKELPRQKLVVIGNGKSYRVKCQRFITKHKLSDRVIFLSDLSLEEIAVIYQVANIMIYPSIFEGFGIPILEALFSKTPIITSEQGCFSEVGGLNSKYINPLSVSAMKEAIMEIQDSSELQHNMTEKGFEYAQKFTDDKIAKNLMEVYTNL